jgi:hypothetical protein
MKPIVIRHHTAEHECSDCRQKRFDSRSTRAIDEKMFKRANLTFCGTSSESKSIFIASMDVSVAVVCKVDVMVPTY